MSPRTVGSHVLIAGTNVTNNNATTIAPKNGINFPITSSTFNFATLHPTNNTLPTGGVIVPIERFITIITPNWIGSIPIAVITGGKLV